MMTLPMKYYKEVTLKDGRTCILRNAERKDGAAVLEIFILTHGQTDFLTSYPDECSLTLEGEEEYAQKKADSEREIEIIAELDGKVTGTAGVDSQGIHDKVKHRAHFGISIDKSYWGLGIGSALMNACIECAKEAGYLQMELEVVADNKAAMSLYTSSGFVEYGRNPKGFRSRYTGWQETVLMRLEL